MKQEAAVRFDSVFFAYDDEPVLEDVSFVIYRGEFAAMTGPNGSGKTTALKLILGLEQAVRGRVTLFGAEHTAAWRGRIGYVPQHPPADLSFPACVRDVVRMGLLRPSGRYTRADRAAADRALEQAGIADLAGNSWKALSGGQRRRALAARALAAQPELLILDEPAANMDAESESRFFETLGKLKGSATILIVTHDLRCVSELADRTLHLHYERIF